MLANMRLCANVLGQNVVQTSLGGYQSVDELLIPGGRIYEQRNFIYKAVNEVPGLSAVKPERGFTSSLKLIETYIRLMMMSSSVWNC